MIRSFYATLTRPCALTLLSVALYLLAFYLPHAWFLIFVALVPFFYALQKARTSLHVFCLGTFFGVGVVGGTTWWILSSLPFAGLSPLLSFALVCVSWCIETFAMALTVGFMSVLLCASRARGIRFLCLAAFLWVGAEYLRMVVFAIVTSAPDVMQVPFFSTGFIGYPLADSLSWLQLGAVGGIYLMSFAAVLVNGCFYVLLKHFNGRSRVYALGSFALLLVLITFVPFASLRDSLTHATKTSLTVGVASFYLPPSERPDNYKFTPVFHAQVTAAVAALMKSAPKLIVLSEGGRYLDPAHRDADSTTPLIIDSRTTANALGENINVAYAGNADGGVSQTLRPKQLLTPQGEYLIGIVDFAAGLIGKGALVTNYEAATHTTPAFGGSAALIPGTSLKGSAIFCVEILAPGFGRMLVQKEGSQMLFFLLSQGRFNDPYTLAVDTLRMLKVRTVEAGVPSVTSGDHAKGYVIDQDGRVLLTVGGANVPAYGTVTVEVPE